jgi:pilus assembly protein CpaF
MLNALCQTIHPPQISYRRERIITVENLAQICIEHENWVRLVSPPVNWKGENEITTRMLVQKALRMDADRVILDDCEGAEARDLMHAMANSHPGSMTSVTATNTADCLRRLENLILLSDGNMRLPMARHLIATASPLIVQVRRLEDGTRRVTEITHVEGLEGDELKLSYLFHLEREGRTPMGNFKVKFVPHADPPRFLAQLEQEAVPFKLEWLGFPKRP